MKSNPAQSVTKSTISQSVVEAAAATYPIPASIAFAGQDASKRFLEFFAATIRNKNTRQAYYRAVMTFFRWTESLELALIDIEPLHIAAYVEKLSDEYAAPTAKQHLAAIRMLFNWLVTGQIVTMNPATAVRGPSHTVKKGKTPVLASSEARELLDSIETDTLIGLRDRALIALMTYSFARVSAAVAMNVEDYFVQRKRGWIRLHEKGGKLHDVPAHHNLEEYLDEYIRAAGIRSDRKGPLFRTVKGRTKRLTANRLSRENAYLMIQKRMQGAGLATKANCHTFRATGITAYLESGGILEHAQQIANHESPTTTKLYDRTSDEITLDEIEKIHI